MKKFTIVIVMVMVIVNSFLWPFHSVKAQPVGASLTYEVNAAFHLPIISGRATQAIQESFVKIAFQAMKKRMFDMVVDQIIDYVNGRGQPQFITDWRGFLETAGQVAVGDFVRAIGLGAMCSPFRLQVQLAMVAPPRFSKQITCTLGTIVRNVENFYNDFRNGGWLAYQEIWAPNNNFYGSLLLAWNAKENEVAARVAAARNEALASQGFLSVKKCLKDPVTSRDIPSTCVVTTPGAAIAALTQKAVSADLDFIINSDDLAVYVAAIADALINRMIRSGVEGLGGIVTASSPNRGYAAGLGCEALIGRAKQDCLSYQNSYGSSYVQASRTTLAQIDAALQPRLAADQIIENLVALETRVLGKLNSLFLCQAAKNSPREDTRALIDQNQQNLNKHSGLKYDNDYVISQLVRAAEDIGQSSTNNFDSLFLTKEMTDATAANKLLTDVRNEQNNNQPSLVDLDTRLPTQINQCQSQ